MEFKVNCGIWGAMFGVPSIVADNFLKLATGEQIKVLLYLLRCSGKVCTDEEISANTGVTASEAEEAVLFWQQANVLSPVKASKGNRISSFMNAAASADKPVISEEHGIKQQSLPDHKTNLSGKEIAAIMNDSQDIRELFTVTENILGNLKNSQMNSIIWMYDHLGLKKEVIITLISYCASSEKTNTAYIEKVASDWAEKEINTLAAAQDEIQRLSSSKDYISGIMRAFEMSRRPTTKQSELINQWEKEGFSIELIRYAYEKTIERIDKLNFDYINKILLSWKDSGFTTVKAVQSAENNYKKKKGASSGEKNSTDIEEYKSVINKFLY